MTDSTRYVKPKKATNFFNQSVARLTRMGISVYGSRVLYVRGRTSGEWRSQPVNPLNFDGNRYLVAPRGNTNWVRNLRAADYRPARATQLVRGLLESPEVAVRCRQYADRQRAERPFEKVCLALERLHERCPVVS